MSARRQQPRRSPAAGAARLAPAVGATVRVAGGAGHRGGPGGPPPAPAPTRNQVDCAVARCSWSSAPYIGSAPPEQVQSAFYDHLYAQHPHEWFQWWAQHTAGTGTGSGTGGAA